MLDKIATVSAQFPPNFVFCNLFKPNPMKTLWVVVVVVSEPNLQMVCNSTVPPPTQSDLTIQPGNDGEEMVAGGDTGSTIT